MEGVEEEYVKKVKLFFIIKNALELYKTSPLPLIEFALNKKLRTEMTYLLSVLVLLSRDFSCFSFPPPGDQYFPLIYLCFLCFYHSFF